MSTETPESETAPAVTKTSTRSPASWDPLDDILLLHLKDNQHLGWKEVALHFQNRTPNACQFRWRRLKSGTLKNPPKSAAAIAGFAGSAAAASASPATNNASETPSDSRRSSLSLEPERKGGTKRRISELTSGLGGAYSLLSNTTFTGYDTVSTALAGLNALSHPGPNNYGSGSAQGPINTTSHPQTFENLPKQDVALDPQSHSAAAAAAGTTGGYFTDISVDPTLNLPHNKPHPVPNSQGITPRNLAVDLNLHFVHNNSIIQIVRDDRNASVSSQLRHSVLSLPSKSMDIPHHHRNSLVHMPALFGGSSISGPAGTGPSSVSGPSGLPHLASTLSSIRNGSIVGPQQAYLRRLSLLTELGDRRASEKEKERKSVSDKASESDKAFETKKASEKASEHAKPAAKSELNTPNRATPTPQQPKFKIPWSLEEDELLINRRRKELSFAELSILLPQRTEGEIWARIDALERIKNGHRALVSRSRRHRKSLLGLDDVDDFYDDVDSVIDGMDSDDDDDDDNDDVLLDVDDSLLVHHRASKKRRASSAVNPLSREGIKHKLH